MIVKWCRWVIRSSKLNSKAKGFCEFESNSIFAKNIKENFDFEPFGDPHSDRREAKGGSLEQKG